MLVGDFYMTQQAVKVDLIPNNRQWQWIGEDFAIHLSGSIGDSGIVGFTILASIFLGVV